MWIVLSLMINITLSTALGVSVNIFAKPILSCTSKIFTCHVVHYPYMPLSIHLTKDGVPLDRAARNGPRPNGDGTVQITLWIDTIDEDIQNSKLNVKHAQRRHLHVRQNLK
ncbi:hypothetical protein AALO_G00301320 [Alosa alosa]|uniref:Secreted protein n=1 Tax=Alosa alosa TaxID=278164 RepID=A0AAV6FJH5_9TELE|nr:hypothetical protein AALO_G00301320 [Alosa alosa]